ncbi:MAG: hypothetical protein HFF07_07785 [Oscillospiraceae bacterium]|nr:hypothetical protein [Oscillospiraceae bacterium]
MRLTIPALLLAGLLVSCVAPAADTPAPLPAEAPVMESPAAGTPSPFDIQTPIVFASYSFQPERYVYKTLLLECTSGRYTSAKQNWNQAWSGSFRFRLADGPSVSLTDDGGVTSCELELSFNGPFLLHVDDYNGDGQPDFALTQWGSTSGGDYGRLFTLNPDGTVSGLPVKGDRRSIDFFGGVGDSGEDTGCFLLPNQHFAGSAELTKLEGGFLVRTERPFIRMLDPEEQGVYFMGEPDRWDASALEDIYLWDGSAFVLTEQRLSYRED